MKKNTTGQRLRKSFTFVIVLFLIISLPHKLFAQNPTLGTYPNTSVISGQNVSIIPGAAPTNTISATAYSNSNFMGLLSVNPSTGVVKITDARQAGTYTVTVNAFGIAGNTATATFILTVTNPDTCGGANFANYSILSVANSPISIAVGDFNGDGNQDIATANDVFSGTVSIRLGNGNGGFTGSTNVAAGQYPRAIVIGDFNGDGNQDFAAANDKASGTVSIRLGDGLGGFSGITSITAGQYPRALAIGDFNGDGKQDLAVSNYSSNTVSIRLGDGLGGFSGTLNKAVGIHPMGVVVGDFNSDGKQDLAVANIGSAFISIRLGNGLGGFTTSTDVAVDPGPELSTIGDFNGDGKQDFAVSYVSSNIISIRLGDGLGGFISATNISGNVSYITAIAIADFNGDGKQDLAVASNGGPTVECHLGDGLGDFYIHIPVYVGDNTYSIAVGDFNNDGRQDFTTANKTSNSASVILGAVNEIDLLGNAISIPDGATTALISDHTDFGNVNVGSQLTHTFTIKNIGTFDLAVSAISINGGDSAMFTKGALTPASPIGAGGSATFTVNFTPVSVGLKQTTIHIANNDCDENQYDFVIQGTGIPSLGNYPTTSVILGQDVSITPSAAPTGTVNTTVYANSNFTGVITVSPVTGLVSINNAKPAGTYTVTVKAFGNFGISATTTFTLNVTTPILAAPYCNQALFGNSPGIGVGNMPQAIAVGDFNKDNKQDFVAANSGSNTVSVRLGNGTGVFSGNTEIAVGGKPSSVAIADFNGDGKQDFVTADKDSNFVSIRLGDGTGGFNAAANAIVGSAPWAIATGDFNGDGRKDFATANYGSDNVSICFGDGVGGFIVFSNIIVGINPQGIAAGDFNNDGNLDFVTANYGSDNISICLGNGTGGFNPAMNMSSGTNPQSIAIGDFNGDGNQDFVTANYGSNDVSIFSGNGAGGFTGATTVAVGNGPSSIAIGDFNRDGKQDFAVVNLSSSTVSFRLGNGSGGFSAEVDKMLPNGSMASAIAIGDFNKDSIPDFAVTNRNLSSVSVCLGDKNEIDLLANTVSITDGSTTALLTNQTDFGYLLLANPNPVYTYKIKNKGKADLNIDSVFATGADAGMFIIGAVTPVSRIAAGDSSTFTITFAPLSTGSKITTVHLISNDCDEADYDFAIKGTGVVASTIGHYPDTTIVTGQNITISPDAVPTNTIFTTAITNPAFTGVLSVNPNTGVITVTNANLAGTYTVNVTAFAFGGYNATTTFNLTITRPVCSQAMFVDNGIVSTGNGPRSIATGDFNSDGKQDVATANFYNSNVSVHFGDGFGGFSGSTNVPVLNQPLSITVGDFNGDGNQDIAAASNNPYNNVCVRLGDGAGGFTSAINDSSYTYSYAYSIAIGDFNGDGINDVATANDGANSITIRIGNGAGGFKGNLTRAVGIKPMSIKTGDFNNDNNLDLAVANYNSNHVSILLGNGAGNATVLTNVSVGVKPMSVVISDFNADGNQDFATANWGSSNLSIKLGNGSGGFSGTTIALAAQPGFLCIGDFNGDGKKDLAVTSLNLNTTDILLGDESGNFIVANTLTYLPFSGGSEGAASGDFNGDGIEDLVVTYSQSSEFKVFLGLANEIEIKGNSTTITDGSNSAQVSNHTDFGNVNLGSNFVRTFTIKNTGTTNLAISAITLSGTDSALFTIDSLSSPSPIAAGDSATFNITFAPSSTGLKSTTVHISNDDCDEGDYDFAIRGNGLVTCTNASLPTLSASSYNNCGAKSTTLSIVTGTLNNATNWKWYKGSCGGTSSGTGTSLIVSPATTTTYYARGEGGCVTPGACASITINVNPKPTPAITGNLTPCTGISTTLSTNVYTSYLWSTGATTQSITVSTNATYKVTVTNASGCTGTATAKVTIQNKPTVTITPSAPVICPPDVSATITAGGTATAFAWSPSSGLNQTTGATVTASPSATTTYMVTGSSTAGCTATKTAKVTVNPKPVTTTTTNISATGATTNWDMVGCAIGYTLQYKVAGGAYTTVNINTNSTSKILTGLTPSTNYQWRIRAKYPNATFSVYSPIVNFVTPALRKGEQLAETENGLNLYPNPATDRLTLEFPFIEDDATIKVINTIGQIVLEYNANVNDEAVELNIQNLPRGLYLIEVANGGAKLVSRVMKN